MHRTSGHSEGFALASALLIVLLLSGFSIGMIYQVSLETHLVETDVEKITLRNPCNSFIPLYLHLEVEKIVNRG